MKMTRLAATLALSAAAAVPALAQDTAAVRAAQVKMMQTERTMVLAMVDSMPNQWFRDKATPAQRDFGMQLYHAVSAVPFLIRASRVGVAQQYTFTAGQDSTGATASKATMRAFVNQVYDWAAGAVQNQTMAQRTQQISLFGQSMTGWQLWDEIHQHTMWTLGQTVANFRGHGMAPPSFMFF